MTSPERRAMLALDAIDAAADALDAAAEQADAENEFLEWESRLAAAEAWGAGLRPVADAVSAAVMEEAHNAARMLAADGMPYRRALSLSLRAAWSRPRRLPLATLRAQAAAWIAAARLSGCRFDAEAKAAEGVRFTVRHALGELTLPTKLRGTMEHQNAAEAAAARMQARTGWIPGTYGVEADREAVALGLPLGFVQAKHARWIRTLGAVRFAVIAVTGGRAVQTERGEFVTPRGVNVALAVGRAALAWHLGDAAEPLGMGAPHVDLAPDLSAELDASEAELRRLFG